MSIPTRISHKIGCYNMKGSIGNPRKLHRNRKPPRPTSSESKTSSDRIGLPSPVVCPLSPLPTSPENKTLSDKICPMSSPPTLTEDCPMSPPRTSTGTKLASDNAPRFTGNPAADSTLEKIDGITKLTIADDFVSVYVFVA
ncbi:uncharacterized protein [Triticum aestivum]|uniref:uncharacterized protein n=1 Tax=Triticum aestivum TaxID=4565 RepID=UPI001D010E91|nr:uncharacterized protein LOC123101738 [Triticum aestivum]